VLCSVTHSLCHLITTLDATRYIIHCFDSIILYTLFPYRNIFEEAKRRNELETEQQLRDDTMSALERAKQISKQLLQEDTILSESGMQTILRDAFEDG
jgi:hypothetical protein